MVQPNNRVYPIVWISREKYEGLKNQLNKLADSTNTDITFEVEEQFFEVKGRSTKSTETVTNLIVEKLISHLYRDIDLLHDTQPNLADYLATSSTISRSFSTDQKRPASPAPNQDDDDDDDDGDDSYSDDSEYSYSDDSLDYMSSKKNKTKTKKAKEVQNKAMQKKKDDKHDTFTFARNVKDPLDILFGPPFEAMAAADYLYVVGQYTETECSLDKQRTIQIFGYEDANVQSAIEMFRFLQTLYKRIRRPTIVVPCLHYRSEAEYQLYFCDLHQYADESYVALPRNFRGPAYILIPSFKDPKSGRFMRPRSLQDSSQILNSPGKQQKPSENSPSIYDQLDERFGRVQMSSPVMSPSTSWSSGQLTGRTNAPQGQNVLWGEQKYTVSPSNSSGRGRGRGRGGNSPATTPAERPRWGAPPPGSVTNEDFPSLGGGSPGRGGGQSQQQRGRGWNTNNTNGRGRRVMRLTPQKSSRGGSPSPPKSMLAMAKEYNMHNIREGLTEGLETARQFRGEVTLVAKLGKVLWRDIPDSFEKSKIWPYTEIKDVCMKEHKIRPCFNNVSITNQDLAAKVWRAVEQQCGQARHSSFFEIHVKSRAKMNESYKPAVLYTESSTGNFFKVHLQQHVLTEVDWVSLDEKFDFQMALTVKEVGRKEVSPFKPFIRRIALRPSANGKTNDLSYQDIGNGGLLQVQNVIHKQVAKFRAAPNVIVQMTRSELLDKELESAGSDAKYVARIGSGSVSFDIEFIYTPYEEIFKENINKPIFKDANWTVDDVFGKNNQTFGKFIVTILQTMNVVDRALERE
ncbi:hypothetical protein BDB00DRAFT_476456 [Zychaea mexicana]|uniref:uncharacterized protein n=1 Tax=Zychaea mexicana TaxID=64656 RepID=UPI0022FE998A|nr:uncharacterized protein BDB00DRAFT_476456 [Zychaea mexicana]KAI9491692.1 hypothetical protein BDB00DRAFT_476456 [Zychaea mexicana]